MSKQGIRALVYVSLVSAMIWGATGYLLVTAVHVLLIRDLTVVEPGMFKRRAERVLRPAPPVPAFY